MLPPKRPSGSLPSPAARVGTGATQVMPVYEIVKARVLVRLHDRLDPAKSRRMPLSLLQQTARQQVEQVIDAEAPRMSRADRDHQRFEVVVAVGPFAQDFEEQVHLGRGGDDQAVGPRVECGADVGRGPGRGRFVGPSAHHAGTTRTAGEVRSRPWAGEGADIPNRPW